MIVCIKTDSPVCEVSTLREGDSIKAHTWEAGRELAKGLLGYIEECLQADAAQWSDVTGIVVFRGPGSFTGLRIGATVANTIAYAQGIAVVGSMGEDWQKIGTERLRNGENDRIVLPEYGREARITQPRK